MTGIFLILGVIVTIWLFRFVVMLFTPAKKQPPKPKPQPKASPAKPKTPAPQKNVVPQPDDPSYLRVKDHVLGPNYRPDPNQPQYVEGIAHIEALLKEHVPNFMVLCLERITEGGVAVPSAIAQLPKHPRYTPGTCINVISADGKIFCINIHPYTATDQTRANFCKRLAKRLGCGCQLYTAKLPNSRGVLVDRCMGCVISQNIDDRIQDQPAGDKPHAIPVTEKVEPIPVNIQTFEWEEIDEED